MANTTSPLSRDRVQREQMTRDARRWDTEQSDREWIAQQQRRLEAKALSENIKAAGLTPA